MSRKYPNKPAPEICPPGPPTFLSPQEELGVLTALIKSSGTYINGANFSRLYWDEDAERWTVLRWPKPKRPPVTHYSGPSLVDAIAAMNACSTMVDVQEAK